MSQWTHVTACIRFDALRMVGMPNMKPDLGITASYEDAREKWDQCNVPCGSEGSLQHYMWEDPNTSSLAAYTAMFWGDLRDYDDEQEILDYFTRITEGKMIRSGVIEIAVEYKSTKVYRYESDPDASEQRWILCSK